MPSVSGCVLSLAVESVLTLFAGPACCLVTASLGFSQAPTSNCPLGRVLRVVNRGATAGFPLCVIMYSSTAFAQKVALALIAVNLERHSFKTRAIRGDGFRKVMDASPTVWNRTPQSVVGCRPFRHSPRKEVSTGYREDVGYKSRIKSPV